MRKTPRPTLSLTECFGNDAFGRRTIRLKGRGYSLHKSGRPANKVRPMQIYMRHQIIQQLTIDTAHYYILSC